MTISPEKLSAFLDGELSIAERHEVEDALASSSALQAELETLIAADDIAKEAFDAVLSEPVPSSLIAAIQNAKPSEPANIPRRPNAISSLAAAAAVAVLMIASAGGGFMFGASTTEDVASARGWLDDIADYHAVYATQVRHLVEVGAEETDHIETWLTNTVGARVQIPDLSGEGLTFQGARLLVAAGKPVAQLIFKDADNRVVALCLIQSDSPADGISRRTIGAFDMVSWGAGNANLVIVGDTGRTDLNKIAETAALDV